MNEDEDLITTVSEACGCSLAHATLALSKCRNNVEYAADWVLQNPEVPLPTPGVAVPRVPDSDETRQWRRFDTESKQCIAMMMYALNVHAWDSEDTNSFVPYDCLEDTMPPQAPCKGGQDPCKGTGAERDAETRQYAP